MIYRVSIFCGGRGSKTIINELLKYSDFQLILLVNAYDDGLSTGALRDLIPGMLGPSDFRKNSTYLLSLHTEAQYALQELIEFRLPRVLKSDYLEAFLNYIYLGSKSVNDVTLLLDKIESAAKKEIVKYLKVFFEFLGPKRNEINFSDYSVGNLLFAGIYLYSNNNFNAAIDRLLGIIKAESKIINVSAGESLTLVALKCNGELLLREAEVVGIQSEDKIFSTFLVSKNDITSLNNLFGCSFEEKYNFLQSINVSARPSKEAVDAVINSDVIIYGPGTQHSSLLPSYSILHREISLSKAKYKFFINNLDYDNDIQGLTAWDLINNCLRYAGDSNNLKKTITHVIFDKNSRIPMGEGLANGIEFLVNEFTTPANVSKHSGNCVVNSIRDILITSTMKDRIYQVIIDLRGKEATAGLLVESIEDVPFNQISDCFHFKIITEKSIDLQKSILIIQNHVEIDFDLTKATQEWFHSNESDYLLTIGGDGEYNFSDFFEMLNLGLKKGAGVVVGSRTQSRKQFLDSLNCAYRETKSLYLLSFVGGFFISIVYMLFRGKFLTDPLSGMQLFLRHNIIPNKVNFKNTLDGLIKNGTEILEYPVYYKTNTGFIRPLRRIKKGIKELVRIVN